MTDQLALAKALREVYSQPEAKAVLTWEECAAHWMQRADQLQQAYEKHVRGEPLTMQDAIKEDR
jgi:hypothetical protein